ncbi:sulfatase family protein [Echinicola shivajiensis]|uniref:sulfatase family protein n=1 Tax=Echinicola shivajiensis TaxID=1035916 RepID=UPI001BFCC228|nr:sulfatase [Echinicola shivajiensis]
MDRIKKKGISFLVILNLVGIFPKLFAHDAHRTPNIVIIFMDDMGYGDLSSYGAKGYMTPNLDQLANEGMRFTDFEVAQPICSASRAGLMTGCYPNRLGISGALNPHSKIGLNPNEETIAELVKRKGDYKTALFGKWHLGNRPPFLPTKQGFDEFVGLPYSNDMWKWTYDMKLATEETHARKASYPELPLMAMDTVWSTVENLEDQEKLTSIYTEQSVRFIHENATSPFLLVLSHSMPHVPLAVSDRFKGKSDQGIYGDVMMEIDWSVGEIVKALDENGLSENTLLIFTSDNGPWVNFGQHAGSAFGLREGKATSFEGGHRVPCIMKWPKVIKEGGVCNKLVSTIDILPTIAEIIGAELPIKKIDGVSIMELLKGNEKVVPRSEFYYYYNKNSLQAVRKGNWKLILPHSSRTYQEFLPGKNGVPGKTGMNDIPLSLYNLQDDPGERYNVEVLYPEKVDELMEIAKKARQDLGDDLLGMEGNNRRVPGRIE